MANYYKLVPTVEDPISHMTHPDTPAGTNFEAKSYDRVAKTCKVKTLRGEVVVSGTEITEQEYLEN